jgi:hypothetical protein
MTDRQSYDLIEALMRIHYYCLPAPKACTDRLKKTKHITAKGDKATKSGEQILERWFARGSDRLKIGKEFK